MGRWNRRYVPRSNRRYKYQDYQWSPPRETYRDPEFGVWQDNVPLWEKKFCFLAGVPWEKVLSTKKYLHCHSNVLDWDDAAGKEAFYNAKEHFRAKLNGGQCEVDLPGPDLYIDKIDWNPYIDPEFIKDLDQTFFVPDYKEKESRGEDLMQKSKVRSGGSSEGPDGRLNNIDNPWDYDHVQTSQVLKDKQTFWDQWDDNVDAREKPTNNGNPWEHDRRDSSVVKNDDSDNPWERYHAQTSLESKDKATGWNQRDDHVDATEKQFNHGNPWEYHNRPGSGTIEYDSWGDACSKKCDWKPQIYLDKSKNSGDNGNKWRNGKSWQEFGKSSQGHNHWEPGISRSIYRNGSSYPAGVASGGASKDTENRWGKKQFGQYDGPRRGFVEGQEDMVGICRKREGSGQYGLGHKGPRLHYIDQTSRRWNNGSSNRRVSFAGQ